MAERLSLSSSWEGSEPAGLGQTKGHGNGGQVTVKADLGPERGTLAWEADGHRIRTQDRGRLSLYTRSPSLLGRGEGISWDWGEGPGHMHH